MNANHTHSLERDLSPPKRRAFHTLDGLRGLGAILVVTRHLRDLGSGISLPETYLAVDLFFLLSGFVIVYAYDQKLARAGFVKEFLVIRLIRLYPLFFLGTCFGVVAALGSMRHAPEWTMHRLAVTIPLAVLMLSPALDTPTWTLLPELIANMIYAAFFRWMSRPLLALLVLMGFVGVVTCRLIYGTLDAGWDLSQLPIIASRLSFSFFGGVLLFRTIGDRRKINARMAWLCIAAVGLALAITPPDPWKAAYELAIVLVVFPLLVCVACQNEPGERASKVFKFLGLVSYAVYVLHQPVGRLFTSLLVQVAHLDLKQPRMANASLVLFIFFMVAMAWLVDLYYDSPVRKYLQQIWSVAKHSASPATPR